MNKEKISTHFRIAPGHCELSLIMPKTNLITSENTTRPLHTADSERLTVD